MRPARARRQPVRRWGPSRNLEPPAHLVAASALHLRRGLQAVTTSVNVATSERVLGTTVTKNPCSPSIVRKFFSVHARRRCALGGNPAQARGSGRKGLRRHRMCCGPLSSAEGFMLYWFRSSQKKKRDARDRNEWIERTIGRLESLDLRRMRGPKTDAAIRKRVDMPRSGSGLKSNGIRSRRSRPSPAASRRQRPPSAGLFNTCRGCM